MLKLVYVLFYQWNAELYLNKLTDKELIKDKE